MKAVIQRVNSASVVVDGKVVGTIGNGLLVLLGVADGDTEKELEWVTHKTVNMRIFEDDQSKMNRSLLDVGGEMLVISQFTLYGDARKGNRPSFVKAACPEIADSLYNSYVEIVRKMGINVETGVFGAYMKVNLENDGPVTIILDSQK